MEEKDLKEKVVELEKRLENIEKKEKKRKIWKTIRIIIKVLILVVIVIFVWKLYSYVKSNYIDPISDIIETKEEIGEYDVSKIRDIIKKIS